MNYIIESERLLLRKFTLNDAKDFYKIIRDRKIKRYVPIACLKTLKETQETINNYYSHCDCMQDFYLVIEDKQSHKIIGAIFAFGLLASKTFEMDILIAKRQRRKGYMTEALLAFISNLPKGSELFFVVDKTNKASLKTVSKLPNAIKKPLTGEQAKYMERFSVII